MSIVEFPVVNTLLLSPPGIYIPRLFILKYYPLKKSLLDIVISPLSPSSAMPASLFEKYRFLLLINREVSP
jgi:hypothetical protein